MTDIRSPDGYPAIGEPAGLLDYSELTARLDFSPEALLPPQVTKLFRNLLRTTGGVGSGVVAPTLLVPPEMTSGPYAGTPRGGGRAFQLELRKESTPNACIYYSAAPLPTEEHLAYLESLEAALTE